MTKRVIDIDNCLKEIRANIDKQGGCTEEEHKAYELSMLAHIAVSIAVIADKLTEMQKQHESEGKDE